MPAGTDRQDMSQRAGADAGTGDLSSFDRAINDLQGRISDLRGSVDDIGRPGAPAAGATPEQPPAGASTAGYEPPPPGYTPPAPPPPYAPPGQEQPYAPPAEQAPPAYEPPPAAYEPPPAYEQAPAAYEPPPSFEQPPAGYETPPYEPAPAYEPPPADLPYAQPPAYPGAPPEPVPEPPPEVFLDSPTPAAAMPAEGSDVLGSFSRVDVGPFEDLLAMTAFEEQLSALPSMANVRVRRFGGGRAEVEVETAGVVPVAREVQRVAPDARPVMQPDGSLVVELTDPRWTGGAPEPQAQEEQDTEAERAERAEREEGEPRG